MTGGIPTDTAKQLEAAKKVELERGMREWYAKQPFPVKAATDTAVDSVCGAIYGFVLGSTANIVSSACPPVKPRSVFGKASVDEFNKMVGGGAFKTARNFAVLYGVCKGISCYLEHLTGKEDVESRMIAGFGGGVAWSLVGRHRLNPISSGIIVAFVEGAGFEVQQKLQAEHTTK